MVLHITPTRLISEVQSEFNDAFPYLKLEFFQNKNHRQNNPEFLRVAHNRHISDCQPVIADGEVEITKDMKVKELEQKFRDEFGLNVQVYRRSGSLWLQTTMTDSWTLEKQNEHGKEISLIPQNPSAGEEEDTMR